MKEAVRQPIAVGAAAALGSLLADCSELSRGLMSPLDGIRQAAIVFAVTAVIWLVVGLLRRRRA